MGIRLGQGGEFDRIRAIAARLGDRAAGLGDDCAILPDEPGTLVTSIDLSVEGVHFRRAWLSLTDIGWRSATAALSDLAAAGARCVGLVAAVSAPRGTPAEELEAVMDGVGAAVDAAGGKVLGGDLTASDRWALAITVFGRAKKAMNRRGAQPGDSVWVTGRLGGARAAVAAWTAGRDPESEARAAFAHPAARLAAGRWLAEQRAHALIDLSDGLAGDAGHIAAGSEVRLEIALDQVPVHSAVAREAAAAGEPPAAFAARGGDDYELLAAMPPAFSEADAPPAEAAAGVRLTRIGRVRDGAGVVLTLDGEATSLTSFDHFG